MPLIKPVKVGKGRWGTKLNTGFWILAVGFIMFLVWLALKNGWFGG